MYLFRLHSVLFIAYCLISVAILVSSNEEGKRIAKEFSLFSVVTFPNTECTTSSSVAGGATDGTCYTSTECSDKSGTASGNCASGFGVCCVFLNVASATSTITQNRTRIRNSEFPGVTTATAATSIVYTVNKMSSDICQIRLDFTTFQIAGPANTEENIAATLGSHCADEFIVTTSDISTWTSTRTAKLCGSLTGEHLYIELSPTSTDTATLTLNTVISTTAPPTVALRTWDIKVSQIECFATYRAPLGCDRYMMEDYGKIISYNFGKTDTGTQGAILTNSNSGIELALQRVNTCIRRAKGMCCVEYQACASYNSIALVDTLQAVIEDTGACGTWNEAFSIDLNLDPYLIEVVEINQGLIDSLCTSDYVEIPSSWSAGCGSGTGSARDSINTRFCGARFGAHLGSSLATATGSPVCDCSEPFRVRHQTDDVNDVGGLGSVGTANPDSSALLVPRGFCLDYRQVPCWQ